jgi:hypothetical protein
VTALRLRSGRVLIDSRSMMNTRLIRGSPPLRRGDALLIRELSSGALSVTVVGRRTVDNSRIDNAIDIDKGMLIACVRRARRIYNGSY